MDPIELSNYAGLGAIGTMTLNILLGLLISKKYNPVRQWPHRRINTVRIHNVTGYVALALVLVHPALLLFPNRVAFHLQDLLYPLAGPKQPLVNSAGAAAGYLILLVVITSYFRFGIGRRWWKRIHFTTYALFPLYAVHALLTDPALKDNPVDWLDGEKVFVEMCVLVVAVAIGARIRARLQQAAPRVHRSKSARAA